jgi:hypothetical protein
VLVDGVFGAVDVGDEVPDAALGVELVAALALALVDERDAEPLREECGLPQMLHERVARPLELLEDLRVGEERDRRASVLRRSDRDHLGRRVPTRELLAVHLLVAVHLRDQPLGERVDDRDAYAMETAGDLVALAAELAAGMKLRQHDGECGQALIGHDVDRDARPVVRNGDGVVRMEDDLDVVGAACKSLVDRVREHLPDEMMEPAGARRADVHTRP